MNHWILLILFPTVLFAQRTVNYPISSKANLTHINIEGPFKTIINRFEENSLQIKFPFEALINEIFVDVTNNTLSIGAEKYQKIAQQRHKARSRKNFPSGESSLKANPAIVLLDSQLQEVQVILSLNIIYHIQAQMTNIVSKSMVFGPGGRFDFYDGKAVIELIGSQKIRIHQSWRTEVIINQINAFSLEIFCFGNLTIQKGLIEDLEIEAGFGEVMINESVYVKKAKLFCKSAIYYTLASGKVCKCSGIGAKYNLDYD